jgi:sporulation protein YlmC with PRC-barrel domain
MTLRSRLIGVLLLLTALLIIGCVQEEMTPPTPIARFTPAVPGAIVQPDVVDEAAAEAAIVEIVPGSEATPSPSALELRPTELGALQLDVAPDPIEPEMTGTATVEPLVLEPAVIALDTVEPEASQPDVIALATIEPSAAEPIVIALDSIEPGARQPQVIQLDVVELGDPQPADAPLTVTELTIIQPEASRLALTELQIIQPELVETPVVGVEAGADRAMLPSRTQPMTVTGTVLEASSLLRHTVVNVDERRLGTLDELIVNLADGQLLFATLTYGGLLNLNLGSRVLPVPPTVLGWDAVNEQLRLGLSNAELNRMDGFGNRWPELENQEWGLEVLSAWRSVDRMLISETPITQARTTPETVRQVSALEGERVRNPLGEELARVDDLLIDLDNNIITHLILRRGGFLGLGSNQYAVPFTSFEFAVRDDNQRQAAMILNANRDDFANAPVYEREQINFDDPDWESPFDIHWQRTSIQPAP